MNQNESAAAYRKLLGMLGMVRRAGKLVIGVSLVLAEVRAPQRRGKLGVVLLSEGSAANSEKEIRHACDHYGVSLRTIPVPPEELGHAVGKTSAICAVAISGDSGLTHAVLERLNVYQKLSAQATDVSE